MKSVQANQVFLNYWKTNKIDIIYNAVLGKLFCDHYQKNFFHFKPKKQLVKWQKFKSSKHLVRAELHQNDEISRLKNN